MNEKRANQVVCPACAKKGDWFAGKYGPFCSHRCKMIDLGKWFGGEHVISDPLRAEHFEAVQKDNTGALDGLVD